jgi:hypothetical protein
MAQWQWITQARNSTAIADVGVALQNRRMTFQLNRPGMASASLRVNDPRARRDTLGGLRAGVHELKIHRDGEAQETVFQLATATVAADTDTMRVDFEWQGIASYLQDALLYPQSTAYSGTTLPWTWINTFQTRTGGDYGITQGSVSGTAPTRQKSVTQEAGLFDTIVDMSESDDGFDWAIDTSRGYREWHPTRGSATGLVLEYGVNVTSFGYTESAAPGEILNAGFIIGPPGTQVVTATDTTSRTTYGRREAALSYFGDSEQSTVTTGQLQAHADSAIANRVAPIIIPQVRLHDGHQSIPWGSYWLGDTVTFRADVGAYDQINQLYRIIQIDVELDENDNENITLGLNAV